MRVTIRFERSEKVTRYHEHFMVQTPEAAARALRQTPRYWFGPLVCVRSSYGCVRFWANRSRGAEDSIA